MPIRIEPNSGTAAMTERRADANRRSWASTPEADDMGIRRATGHFSSVITTPSTSRVLANSNTVTRSAQADLVHLCGPSLQLNDYCVPRPVFRRPPPSRSALRSVPIDGE